MAGSRGIGGGADAKPRQLSVGRVGAGRGESVGGGAVSPPPSPCYAYLPLEPTPRAAACLHRREVCVLGRGLTYRRATPTLRVPPSAATFLFLSQEGKTALEIAKGENNTEMVRHCLPPPYLYTPTLTRIIARTRTLTLTLTRCSAWRS